MDEVRITDDLISRSELKKAIKEFEDVRGYSILLYIIDNAPTVKSFTLEDIEGVRAETIKMMENRYARPQGEYVDISKLRLMTVEECAGHTIDYAMGWKACIEWIKNGGADMRGEKE